MKTRQRGLRRKCQSIIRQIEGQTATFPESHRGSDYWHLHLPVSQDFIDSQAIPLGVRRLCVQTLIDRAHHLAAIAPKGQGEIRVVVAIQPSNLWASQIIVFFGPDYFNGFFNRKTETQQWSKLESKSLVRIWCLALPEGFVEKGYEEQSRDEAGIHESQIWFMGQLPAT